VLEVLGATLGRGVGLGNDIVIVDITVNEISYQIGTELRQVFGEGHITVDRGADREHVGEETDNVLELGHRVLSDSSANDEGALSRVLVEGEVVDGKEVGERRGVRKRSWAVDCGSTVFGSQGWQSRHSSMLSAWDTREEGRHEGISVEALAQGTSQIKTR
jgi:hypothetical protein